MTWETYYYRKNKKLNNLECFVSIATINNREKLPSKLRPIQTNQHYKKPALVPPQPSEPNEKYLKNNIVAEKQIDIERCVFYFINDRNSFIISQFLALQIS